MNLQAVLLFVCISAAYGLQCKQGNDNDVTIDGKASRENENTAKMAECKYSSLPEGVQELCGRMEIAYSGLYLGHSILYFCSGNVEGCRDKKDGECFSKPEKDDQGIKQKFQTCCSSDPEFKNSPAITSPGSSSPTGSSDSTSGSGSASGSDSSPTDSSSSAFSIRALLAVIAVFFF